MQEEVERLRLEVANQERDQVEKAAEELHKKEQEEQDCANIEQTQSHDDLLESSVPSSSIAIEYPAMTLEFGLIPFIPFQEQEVADLNTIF